MTLEIYHQLGHNSTWNFESIRCDQTGQGVIISPKFMGPAEVDEIERTLLRTSIFDPQFFLPRSALKSLAEYDFFPDNVAQGFNTQEYPLQHAKVSAERCVRYQIKKDFRYIVIPTRQMPGMPATFVENQQELFVGPFEEAIATQGPRVDILLQLVLNPYMIKDQAYCSYLLNWITGLGSIDGVYLILETPSMAKQISDADLLYSYLVFIDELVENQLSVVLGYLNSESFLLSLANPKIVTMGVYENTRMFDIRNFEQSDKKQKGGPIPRLYTSKLLQWIDHRYIKVITDALGEGMGFFDDNIYRATMFEPTYQWFFTKPELYKHAFVVINDDLEALGDIEGKSRYEFIRDRIREAMGYYQRIEAGSVVLDSDSGGNHLAPWLTAANRFALRKGW